MNENNDRTPETLDQAMEICHLMRETREELHQLIENLPDDIATFVALVERYDKLRIELMVLEFRSDLEQDYY